MCLCFSRTLIDPLSIGENFPEYVYNFSSQCFGSTDIKELYSSCFIFRPLCFNLSSDFRVQSSLKRFFTIITFALLSAGMFTGLR